MSNLITMTVRNDGWVKGVVNGFDFVALVHSEPTTFGINQGRVSKLFLFEGKKQDPVICFDRGWKREVDGMLVTVAYQKLLTGLESLPA